MQAENAIEVRDLTKKFKVYMDKGNQLKERMLFRNRNRYEERWVLNGISFNVRKGEAIGLIGHNGCGKSTTLKLLTKIIYPDTGSIEMRGRVSSLIELGAGFHPDMSGRENIYTNASIFGLKKEEIDKRVNSIIEFSELQDFIDNPVRTYSSGMYMRLAFSVAIHVGADILLIDEILAVGAEFMNEPNLLSGSGAPKGYTVEHFLRDQDIFNKWVHENYPECLTVGPCSVGGGIMGKLNVEKFPLKLLMKKMGTEAFIKDAKEPMEVFSYHYYNGVSERIAAGISLVHWPEKKINSEKFLDAAPYCAKAAAKLRDKYMPGAQLWVTESGDAGGGGDTWASTYVDVLRTLNELGTYATITDGIVFHNTLASSDYGWLRHGTFDPRPNYYAILLWNRLMGTTVYDSEEPIREGAHVFCHSRKDGKEGYAYLIINNSKKEYTTVEIPKEATCYTLSGNGKMRSTTALLNGKELVVDENDNLPSLEGEVVSGAIKLAPGTCTFLVI